MTNNYVKLVTETCEPYDPYQFDAAAVQGCRELRDKQGRGDAVAMPLYTTTFVFPFDDRDPLAVNVAFSEMLSLRDVLCDAIGLSATHCQFSFYQGFGDVGPVVKND